MFNYYLWALVPPVLAIIFALATKEVNISLIAGIFVGTLIFTGFKPFESVTTMISIMGEKVGSNYGVLLFLVLLGMLVALMNKSGATHQYALWAEKKLKTKKQTLLATMFLGILIFIDDYFNCLTVGTVMRPISDRKKISREKLAYIIDSTAAPVCIIAPVSSWAAAVSSSLPDGSTIDGFQLFLKTIGCNYYAWLSLIMVFLVIVIGVDYGKMKQFEEVAQNATDLEEAKDTGMDVTGNGKVLDLILPVAVLIVLCITGMLYTGGFFEGVNVADAFANCDAMMGLSIGAFYTVIFTCILYVPRKIVTFKEFMESLVEGFNNMVPTLLILIFAWTLSGICGVNYLNTGGVVGQIVMDHNVALKLMPGIFFAIAMFLSMATGTAWGTFAILLPIAVSVFNDAMTPTMVLTSAAVLSGSVCGDHLSPISDTTIMSSTGASCHHIDHVASQMQYGLAVATISVICYFVGAETENLPFTFILGALLVFIYLMAIKKYQTIKAKENAPVLKPAKENH